MTVSCGVTLCSKSDCDCVQFARLCLGIELHACQNKDVSLDLRQEGAQGINTSGPIALGRGAGLVPHDLSKRASRCPSGFALQEEQAAQAVDGPALDASVLQGFQLRVARGCRSC